MKKIDWSTDLLPARRPGWLILWMLCAAMFLGLAAPTIATAQAEPESEREQEKRELKERFKARYPRLLIEKRAHTIGETFVGYVEAVDPNSVKGKEEQKQTLRKLIEEENADRKRLYQIIAEEENTKPEVVARQNAERNFAKAEPGMYLQDEKGKWYQKPEKKKE